MGDGSIDHVVVDGSFDLVVVNGSFDLVVMDRILWQGTDYVILWWTDHLILS